MADESAIRSRSRNRRKKLENNEVTSPMSASPEHNANEGGVTNPSFEGDDSLPRKARRRKERPSSAAMDQNEEQPARDSSDPPKRRQRRTKRRETDNQATEEGDLGSPTPRSTGADEEALPVDPGRSDGAHNTGTAPGKRRRRRRRGGEPEGDPPVAAETLSPPHPTDPVPQPPVTLHAVPDPELPPHEIPDMGKVVSVVIHRADPLRTDLRVTHPLVRVHFIDKQTGCYLKKQNPQRKVTSIYEDLATVDYIQPVLSKPYDFKVKKSKLPMWEEHIILNENFDYIKEYSRVILFFEILDMVRPSVNNPIPAGGDTGWHRIAWGFLKPRGANRTRNVDRKIRLQLYEPHLAWTTSAHNSTYVYEWHRSNQFKPYPATLYVTLAGVRISPKANIDPELRALLFSDQAQGTLQTDYGTGSELDETKDGRYGKMPSFWNRLPGQMCKVPNRLGLSLPTGSGGCHSVKFSPDGKWLACGCQDKSDYPVLLYEFPECGSRPRYRLVGHNNLIYGLAWSSSSRHLASTSQDGTVRVWSVGQTGAGKEKVLAHPGYVYTAQFHPATSSFLVTGCYDKVIRVWCLEGDKQDLIQEIDGHKGHVNSVAFDPKGEFLFSGDSVGVVREWAVSLDEKKGGTGALEDWKLKQEIREPEIAGIPINHIQVHPTGQRLLIHTRDSTLRMLHLRIGVMMVRYQGALNYSNYIRSTITPCGSFVIAGSEDMNVYIWNAETGDQVAKYSQLNIDRPICTVDYHPMDHSVAMSCIVSNGPVLVYGYDLEMARMDSGMYSPIGSPRSRPTSPVLNREAEKHAEEHMHSISHGHKVEQEQEKLRTLRSNRIEMESEKFRQAMQKLNSVVGGSLLRSSMTGPGVDESLLPGQLPSSRRSGYETLSPHLSLAEQAHQYSAQKEYFRQGWRPQFVPVGKASSIPTERPPQLSLTASSAGRPTFSFQKPHKDINYSTTGSTPTPEKEVVVAIYDYQAARSDELTFVRGDIILVLYKDTDNWWMGQLDDGSQGFFPTNYVAGSSDDTHVPPPPAPVQIDASPDKDQGSMEELNIQRQRYASVLDKMDKLQLGSGDEAAQSPKAEPVKPRRRRHKPEAAPEATEMISMAPDSGDLPRRRKPPRQRGDSPGGSETGSEKPASRQRRRRPPSQEHVAESVA